jgi:hypothetical protein
MHESNSYSLVLHEMDTPAGCSPDRPLSDGTNDVGTFGLRNRPLGALGSESIVYTTTVFMQYENEQELLQQAKLRSLPSNDMAFMVELFGSCRDEGS